MLIAALLAASSLPAFATAINIDPQDASSVKAAAKTVASGVLSYYSTNQPGDVPGLLLQSPPGSAVFAAFQLSGLVWDALISYWAVTGDSQYNALVTQALEFQLSPTKDFLGPNQTESEGNDAQGIWGLASLTAAERNLPGDSGWASYAENVFNDFVGRWDTSTCGGGLRWQIYVFDQGYVYKNAISNGEFFQLSARLARYTGNQTYVQWANKIWDWSTSSGLVAQDSSVYDGLETRSCSNITRIMWTDNFGTYLYGSAVMYNITNGGNEWKTRVTGLLQRAQAVFTKDNVLFESACESTGLCDLGMQTYKGTFANELGLTAAAAPFTADMVNQILGASAKAAAATCTGNSNGTDNACSFQWTLGMSNGTSFSAEYSAFQVIQANLFANSNALATQSKPAQAPSSSGSGSTTSQSPVSSSSASGSSGTTTSSGASADSTSSSTKTTTNSKAAAPLVTANVLAGVVGAAAIFVV